MHRDGTSKCRGPKFCTKTIFKFFLNIYKNVIKIKNTKPNSISKKELKAKAKCHLHSKGLI